jgi:hypothetical protein
MRLLHGDIALSFGLVALIVFGHLAAVHSPASATSLAPLLLQGAGTAYGEPVNEKLTPIELGCRRALAQLSSTELNYAAENPSGEYGYLQDLVLKGYLQPNATGRSLAANYSVAFYLDPVRSGFTLVAEPQTLELRALMVTENRQVVPLTPSIDADPNDDWRAARERRMEHLLTDGYYDFISTFELVQYDTLLQARLNRERTEYVLLSLEEREPGLWAPDDSIVYVSAFASYMRGDTREPQEGENTVLEELPEETD